MKRGHRRAHLYIWLFVAGAMALTLYLAITLRPTEPVNDTLPALLETEAS